VAKYIRSKVNVIFEETVKPVELFKKTDSYNNPKLKAK
jgi:hypothetical protein